MMAKFFLGIAIVAFTSFCGYVLAKKYRQRKNFFAQLREFNERFLNEISYYRRPLAEFVSKYAYKGEFNRLLECFFRTLGENSYLFEEDLQGAEYNFLTREEKGDIKDYFFMLGKGDSASQKTYFSSVKDRLLQKQTETEKNCKKYGDLYVKLGFLIGLLILILII